MPDLFAHQLFGRRVLEGLPADINVDEDIFMWAQEGPDFWSYLLIGRHESRSQIMHEQKGWEFITCLVDKYSKDKVVFSYAMGFLCHIIYDEMVHPFIEFRIDNTEASWYCGGHLTLERALDMREMRKHDEKPWSLCKAWPTRKAKRLAECLDCVYDEICGWKKAFFHIRIAYCFRFFVYLIFCDPLWLLYSIGRMVKSERICSFSYHGKTFPNIDVENMKHDNWGESDLSFDEISDNAVAMAIEKIIAIYYYPK